MYVCTRFEVINLNEIILKFLKFLFFPQNSNENIFVLYIYIYLKKQEYISLSFTIPCLHVCMHAI